jgi:thymidylate synthase (FAD)
VKTLSGLTVTLTNKADLIDGKFFQRWGTASKECYQTEDGEKSARAAFNSHHFSGSRKIYFDFAVSGISLVAVQQLLNHSVGIAKQQQSQGRIQLKQFEMVIPETVFTWIGRDRDMANHSPQRHYLIQRHLANVQELYERLIQDGVPISDARYFLPHGTTTRGEWAFDLEALEQFCRDRCCNAAKWEIRSMAWMVREEAIQVVPELDKWLGPKCWFQKQCWEAYPCGNPPNPEGYHVIV